MRSLRAPHTMLRNMRNYSAKSTHPQIIVSASVDECAQPVHVCPRCSSVALNTMRQPSHVREHTRMCCLWVAEVSKHRKHFTHVRPGVRMIRPFVHATLNLTQIAHTLAQKNIGSLRSALLEAEPRMFRSCIAAPNTARAGRASSVALHKRNQGHHPRRAQRGTASSLILIQPERPPPE